MKLQNRHWLLIIFILILTYLSFYFLLTNYEQLPDMIPTHFNLQGEPDAWSTKTLGSVLMAPIILLIINIFMLGLTWWISRVEDPLKIINLPKKRLAKLPRETAEEIREITVLHLLIITFLISLMIFVITINQVKTALGQSSNLAVSMGVVTLLLVIDSMYLTWKTISLTSKY